MKHIKKFVLLAMVPALFVLASCEKEYPNPNAATKDAVITSVDGLLGLIVGIKKEYSVGATGAMYNLVSCNGFTTKELYVINTGNGELAALEAGGQTLGGANSIMSNLWTSLNLVKSYSQLLIDNAKNVSDPGTSNGILVYGQFFKALAIGTMTQFWEKVPTEIITSDDFLGGKNANFVARTDALQLAVQLLNDAATSLNATPVSTYFTSKVGSDISIANAIQALLARYNIMLGKNAEAIAAADKVDLTKKSIFKYEALNPNPVFRTSLVNNNTYNGVHDFGLTGDLAPTAGDGRITFYLNDNPATGVKVLGFFTKDEDPIPLYLPGEILLTKAEAQARSGNVNDAITTLNSVLTKTNDIFGVNAGLQAYSGSNNQADVLKEIYRNRCIELYMSGLKLEDSRRFGRPGPGETGAERNRNFYPYPTRERDNNPNTPDDPIN